MTDFHTIYLLGPEIALIAMATIIYIAGAFKPLGNLASWLGAGGLLIAAVLLYMQDTNLQIFMGIDVPDSGPLAVDAFGHAARWGVLLLGLLLLLGSAGSAAPQTAEYVGSLLLVFAGLMLVAASREMVLLFVGLELISIPTYVLLYLGQRGPAGQEATVKYFFLSILASALLLYGLSFLYGVSGSTRLADLARVLSDPGAMSTGGTSFAQLGLILVFAGLGFRLTAVPFHFYAADVYQGTSHANAGLLSTLPKVAAVVALVRVAAVSMPGMEPLAWKICMVLSVLTMTVGNLLALWQDNVRRLLAYSSIAHGGYMLIGLAVAFAAPISTGSGGNLDGVGSVMFYLALYAFSTIGAFAALAYLGRQGQQIDGVEELSGLGRTHAGTAIALAIFMFSLTGIPPLAGFWGKFALFTAALETDPGGPLRHWFVALAVVGVLNAAVSAAYYLRVVSVMYFRAPLATPKAEGGLGPYAAMIACALLVLAAGFYPGPLLDGSNRAGRSAMSPVERAGAGTPEEPSRLADE